VSEHLDVDPEFGGEPTDVLSVLLRRSLNAIGLNPDAADRGNPELLALRQIKRRVGVKRSEKAFIADVYVTTDGLMYVSDWNGGMHVLQYEG
jgi:hypothetical protein